MSIATETVVPGLPADPPFDLTTDVFLGMIEAGLIPRERPIYLRDGRLFEKMAKTKAHAAVASAFNGALARRLPPDWCLWPEGVLALDPHNSPLPDLMVVRGSNPLAFLDEDRHPGPGDVGLLIEIAVTSLPDDLGPRLEKYARAGIPAYWVADVHGRRVLAHAMPRVVNGRGEYARVDFVVPGTSLPLVLDGREVAAIPYEEVMR